MHEGIEEDGQGESKDAVDQQLRVLSEADVCQDSQRSYGGQANRFEDCYSGVLQFVRVIQLNNNSCFVLRNHSWLR